MKLFSTLYARVMQWSTHPHAPRYLGGLSFAESSFFPIPPDVMLAPMSLANPDKAWRYALLTTMASVLGGCLGYAIGMFAFELVEPWIHKMGYWHGFESANEWFKVWGFWAVFLAGFSPIPYKVFTIGAGVIGMFFPIFVLASLIGRGARFFLVAALMVWGGDRMEKLLREYVDKVGLVIVLMAVVTYVAVNHG